MSDPDWGDLDRVPRKRQGPKVFFCALGCLLPVALLMAVAAWVYVKVDRGRDPDLQWQRLRRVIHYDERPPGWTMRFGLELDWFDFKLFVLTRDGEGPRAAATFVQPGQDVESFFDVERPEVSPWSPPGADEPLRSLEVQGRELRVARIEGGEAGSFLTIGLESEDDEDRPVIALELTPEHAAHPLVLYWAHEDLSLLTPAELRAFLAPFRVGPER